MMLKRTGPNTDLLEHFLSRGSLLDVSEAQIGYALASLKIAKVPRYQEQRAATKSKVTLGIIWDGVLFVFHGSFIHPLSFIIQYDVTNLWDLA